MKSTQYLASAKLYQRSENLHKNGMCILENLGLLEILSTYGKVSVVGSFDLEVLVKPDIDMYILVDKNDIDRHFTVAAKVAKTLKPYRVKFINQFVAKRPELPAGYFLGINLEYMDNDWSIDAWALEIQEFERVVRIHQEIKKRLGEEHIEPILEIKNHMYGKPEYVSYDVYRSVLWDGVDSIESFEQWRSNKSS